MVDKATKDLTGVVTSEGRTFKAHDESVEPLKVFTFLDNCPNQLSTTMVLLN